MDVISKIAIGAAGAIVIIVVGLGFYSIASSENEAKCEEMRKSVNEHFLAHNQSADYYDYRVNRLHGHFDLQGELMAWKNLLLNNQAYLVSTLA
jgi:hypothetical protein